MLLLACDVLGKLFHKLLAVAPKGDRDFAPTHHSAASDAITLSQKGVCPSHCRQLCPRHSGALDLAEQGPSVGAAIAESKQLDKITKLNISKCEVEQVSHPTFA